MQSIQLYNHETEHTSNWSKVVINENKIYQESNHYRDISSQEQMAKVIENLVINKGFVMKNQRDQVLTLENPIEPETIYWIWTGHPGLGITKKTKKLVGMLEV